jgi:phosphomannomutase
MKKTQKQIAREQEEAAKLEQMRREHPDCDWGFVWGPNGDRILVSIPNDEPDAELPQAARKMWS